jgi:hypothetical protein
MKAAKEQLEQLKGELKGKVPAKILAGLERLLKHEPVRVRTTARTTVLQHEVWLEDGKGGLCFKCWSGAGGAPTLEGIVHEMLPLDPDGPWADFGSVAAKVEKVIPGFTKEFDGKLALLAAKG